LKIKRAFVEVESKDTILILDETGLSWSNRARPLRLRKFSFKDEFLTCQIGGSKIN